MITKKYNNKFNLPSIILEAIRKADSGYKVKEMKIPEEVREKKLFSVTGLLRPAYMTSLEKNLNVEVEVDISDRIGAARGTALHSLIEKINSGVSYLSEEPFWLKLEEYGQYITGTIDFYNMVEKTLYDLKSVKTYALGKPDVFDSWTAQLNIYRYLMIKGSGSFRSDDIESLVVIGWIDGWLRGLAEKNPDYPQSPIVSIPVPIWPEEQTIQFIYKRVEELLQADLNPEQHSGCSNVEKWQGQETWIVRKKGSDRALPKSKFTGQDAEKIARSVFFDRKDKDNCEVVCLPALPIRCLNYCDVSSHCRIHQEYVKNNGGINE
jgi:hypothetical protein